MISYEWINGVTKEIRELEGFEHATTPPDDSGEWQRHFRVSVGRVSGAGGSPARSSVRHSAGRKEKDGDS